MAVLLNLGFAYMGYYTLIRFNLYATQADRLADIGLKRDGTLRKIPDKLEGKCSSLKEFFDAEKSKADRLLFPIQIMNYLGASQARLRYRKLFMAFWYWTTILLISLVVFSGFWTNWIDFVLWLTVSLVTIFAVVRGLPLFLSKRLAYETVKNEENNVDNIKLEGRKGKAVE